jgi:hypothetical protein
VVEGELGSAVVTWLGIALVRFGRMTGRDGITVDSEVSAAALVGGPCPAAA